MDILFHVTTHGGGQLLASLAQAATRAQYQFGVFFTHEGVLGLKDEALQSALVGATKAVVCEESWHRFCHDAHCPVEMGSQTSNSAMMGEAERVVSL